MAASLARATAALTEARVSPGLEQVRERQRERRGVDEIAELAEGVAGRDRRPQEVGGHAVGSGDVGSLRGPAAGECDLHLGHGAAERCRIEERAHGGALGRQIASGVHRPRICRDGLS
jgi:hypothetical protein